MPSRNRPIVFLDDGGVMNDNTVRAPQWRKLLGQFMPPVLGGTPERWAEANRVTFPLLWTDISSRLAEFAHHADFQREYDLLWLRGMCELIGVPVPSEDLALEIATSAARYITARVRSEYPDAIPAIRSLHAAGFELHTASGTRSLELEGILGAMGVRECFGHLFGPDLLDTMKAGPEYYRRVFEQTDINPALAVVIEDSGAGCSWAREAGATAIQVVRDATAGGEGIVRDFASAARYLIETYR